MTGPAPPEDVAFVPHASRRRRPVAGLLVAIAVASSGCGERTEVAPVVASREAGGLHAVLPTVALVGSPVTLAVSPLDELGTPARDWSGTLSMTATDPALLAPAPFGPGTPGSFVRPGIIFRTPGVHRVTVTSDAGESAVAGPVLVVRTEEELRWREGEAALRAYWGDAHGHSDVGDGTNPPGQYLYYARDVAHLDFVCLSEHDFQQFLEVGLDVEADGWERIVGAAREWRRPGFAVLTGWEWSSREHGHRVVLFPDDEPRWVSFRRASTPAELERALAGTGALSVIAHPTGSRLTPPVNWETVAPGLDRAIEIYSGHGTMDGTDDFRPTSDPLPGHSALDAIRRGLPLAIVAFSDTHLSTPGNPWPPAIRDAPWPGGLTGVWAEEATERAVLEAIRAGRSWASSGPRFLVRFSAGERTMGGTLVAAPGEPVRVRGLAAGPSPLARVELLLGDRVVADLGGGDVVEFDRELGPFAAGVALWLRGRAEDGERFWTTPVRVVAP